MVVQLFIIIVVFSSFVGMGFYIWHGYRSRKVFFENLLLFCNHLSIEISFSKNTIRKIIDTYGTSYGKNFQKVLLGYQSLIDQKSDITRDKITAILGAKLGFPPLKLKPAETENIADFFCELGKHDSPQEHQKIQAKRLAFDTFFGAANHSFKVTASTYLKIFILMGVGAVILLL